MTSQQHPRYPNPTIQEALCEMHFRLPDRVEWSPALFGEFYKAVQDEFPDMEPATQIGFQLQVGPSGVAHTLGPPQPAMRYRHKSKNLQLQLRQGILTVNVLPKYPGWQRMRADVMGVWRVAADTIRPAAVSRIGLRYIDFIKRDDPRETPGDWLASNDFIPCAVLRSLPGFLARTEVRTDEDTRLIVALGETSDDSHAIVMDVDCIVERELGPDANEIAAETDRLHGMASDVFFSAMTERLEGRLRGR